MTSLTRADGDVALVFPRRIVRVEAGALGVTRYGSGNPWPWDPHRGQVS